MDQEVEAEPVIDFDVKHFRHAIKSESYFDGENTFIDSESKNNFLIF